jgi:hypothetical protein
VNTNKLQIVAIKIAKVEIIGFEEEETITDLIMEILRLIKN